jgi:hypothetical protein
MELSPSSRQIGQKLSVLNKLIHSFFFHPPLKLNQIRAIFTPLQLCYKNLKAG